MNPRTPSELPPHRMEPLARLPVFLALEGKRAVVADFKKGERYQQDVSSRMPIERPTMSRDLTRRAGKRQASPAEEYADVADRQKEFCPARPAHAE